MLKGLVKAIAYIKAPKKTFLLLHPRKAIKWGGLLLVAKMLSGRARKRGAREART